MNTTNPFDHQSLMYKLMKYLYKIESQMQMVPYVWILIDVVQFLTIVTSLMGYVIKQHYSISTEQLFDNFLNIFFNYEKIYDWLVISGACSAFIVILALIFYVLIEFRKEIKENTKRKLLGYCALTGTVSIGLFEFFSQVMANNLINIVSHIFKRELEMNVVLICCFLLNMVMMVFVSIFNADRRIFRFSLVLVSLGLNILAFTYTCIMLICLSIYYQYLDKLVYKKLFYMLIIAISLWCSLEVNDTKEYLLTAREVYLGMAVLAVVVYYLHYDHEFLDSTFIDENQYLVKLYNKRLKKEDKKEDYMLADQYFTRYFSRDKEKPSAFSSPSDSEFYLTSSVQDWSEVDFKQRVIQKIKTQRLQNTNTSLMSEVQYFQLLLQLKINMVQLLNEVFQFMSQKRHQNIQVIYEINKLTHRIEQEFSKNPGMDENVLKLDDIIELQEFYKQFYSHFVKIVGLLEEVFDGLDAKHGQITQNIEEKLAEFTQQQKKLEKTLKEITSITGPKLETKLYVILAQIWGKYQKSSQSSHHFQNPQQYNKLPHQLSKQKFSFSYVVISHKTIKYASIKFLSTYSYKESYIVGENMSVIFPSKFSLYVMELFEKNVGSKVFVTQLPVLNQKGTFQIVNATFYLIPEFKGEITYIVQFRKIPEFQSKSLFLFNTETLCIECFNKKMIQKFSLSLSKITGLVESGAIQFSNLFVFNSDEKDFFHFTQKQTAVSNRANKRVVVQNHPHSTTQKFNKDNEKVTSIKALMKMEYLSELKKSVGKNVTLESEISFDISNITYKLIKVEDATPNKNAESSALMNERSEDARFFKELNKSKESQFQSSTKDLKKKYQNEEFFCPISNPYTPRILQKLNMINSRNRVTNVKLVKIVYAMSLLLLLGGMVGFKVSTSQFSSQIQQFQNQAQSINEQYSFYMSSVLRAYQLQHMQTHKEQFIAYIQNSRQLNYSEAATFYETARAYAFKEKNSMIKKFQDVYFNYPILNDTEAIIVKFVTNFFELNSTSKTTLIYDVIVILMDSQNPVVKVVLAQNFDIYETMMNILRPDGRYNDKIKALDKEPAVIVLVAGVLIVVCFGILYYLLFQLREAREDIVLIYKYIEKDEIFKYKRKVEDVQELIEILSNNKKNSVDQPQSPKEKHGMYNTISQLNSANNIKAEQFSPNGKDGVKGESEIKFQQENQSERLLGSSRSNKQFKNSNAISKKFKSETKMSIFIETILKYPIYILFMISSCGILFYAYYSANEQSNSFMQAFKYFQKIRAVNFQFRYLYVMAQSQAYYSSVMGVPIDSLEIKKFAQKNTHFAYEKPEEFSFQTEQNLCSQENIESIVIDPFMSNLVCEEVDFSILIQGFSQAFEQFETNLRMMREKSYAQLITDPYYQKAFFNTMYEYFAFENYLDKLSEENFIDNVNRMGEIVNMDLFYVLFGAIAWVVFSFLLAFIVTIPKLETELATIVSLIKMIPPETMFSMKVAALFKKRNILEKLNRL